VRCGINIDQERKKGMMVKTYPFDSIKKQSSVIVKMPDGHLRRYYKGASEAVVRSSVRYINPKGQVVAMDETSRARIVDSVDGLTCQGLRTIGFGYYDLENVEYDDTGKLIDPEHVDELVWIGVVGIKDPLRAETTDSVRKCQKAGIVVRMVTGDHVDTARFIARECGILTSPNHIFMTGDQFRKLINSGNEQELERVIPKLRVLARSKPEDKETLVLWLKAHGEVVAATGDGTNDAPALKAANVGVAMFIVGTQVAKAAAEINILDDNFASIVKAVVWGRSVYDNIRKFVQFQLTINIVALAVSLIGACSVFFVANATLTGAHHNTTPLKAVQLLWVNLIMDTMAALALGTELPTDSLLDRAPYEPMASLCSPIMWRNIFWQSALQLGALLLILYSPNTLFGPTVHASMPPIIDKSVHHYTLIFNSFVFLQVFNEINSRKVNGELNVFENFWGNYIFHAILIITVFFQWVMVEVLSNFSQSVPLSLWEWIICVLIGAFSLPWGAIGRLIPVDEDSGRRKVPPETFEGADWIL
jgi:Ca2+-transporting ATPase